MKCEWKKISVLLLVLTLVHGFVSVQAAVAADPVDARYQKLSEEIQRNKELLEIWKDHVKTVTKERDEALRQVEALKMQKPPAAQSLAGRSQFGAVEVMPVTPPNDPFLNDLRARNTELEQENQRLLLIQKELQETRQDKETILREKEEALRKVQALEASTQGMPSSGKNSKNNSKEFSDALKEMTRLKKDNENLKKTAEKLEKSDAERKSLSEKNKELTAQNAMLIKGAQNQTAPLQAEIQKLKFEKEEADRFSALRIEALNKEKDEAVRQAQSLRFQTEKDFSRLEKSKVLESELASLKQDREAFLTTHAAMANSYQSLESQVKTATDERKKAEIRVKELESENESLEKQVTRLSATERELDNLRITSAGNISNLEAKIQSLEANAQEQLQALNSWQAEAQSEKNKRAQAEKNLADLGVRLAGLQKEKQDNLARLEAYQLQTKSLRSENEQLVQNVKTLREKLSANVSDIQNLKQKFDTLTDSTLSAFEERVK